MGIQLNLGREIGQIEIEDKEFGQIGGREFGQIREDENGQSPKLEIWAKLGYREDGHGEFGQMGDEKFGLIGDGKCGQMWDGDLAKLGDGEDGQIEDRWVWPNNGLMRFGPCWSVPLDSLSGPIRCQTAFLARWP